LFPWKINLYFRDNQSWQWLTHCSSNNYNLTSVAQLSFWVAIKFFSLFSVVSCSSSSMHHCNFKVTAWWLCFMLYFSMEYYFLSPDIYRSSCVDMVEMCFKRSVIFLILIPKKITNYSTICKYSDNLYCIIITFP
jgi:hypothetical protein